MMYVALTVVRLVACLRIASWLYQPGWTPRPSPSVRALGIYFYIVSAQRGLWLVRSGLSTTFTTDTYVMVGISLEAFTLLVLCWFLWKRTI